MVVASMAAATLNLPSFADLKAKKAEHKANKFNQTTTVAPETRSINETETAIPVAGSGSRIVWVQQMVYVPVLVSDNTTGADAIRSGGLKAQMGGIPTSILSKNLKSVVAAPPGMVSPYLAYSNTNPPVVGIVASARASSDDQLVESVNFLLKFSRSTFISSCNCIGRRSPKFLKPLPTRRMPSSLMLSQMIRLNRFRRNLRSSQFQLQTTKPQTDS